MSSCKKYFKKLYFSKNKMYITCITKGEKDGKSNYKIEKRTNRNNQK